MPVEDCRPDGRITKSMFPRGTRGQEEDELSNQLTLCARLLPQVTPQIVHESHKL